MLAINVRHALRLLRASPGFASVAVLTLALGIGANTAVFSVIDAVMLKPLPYADPDRLAFMSETNVTRPGSRNNVAPANLVDYMRANQSFEGLAGYDSSSMSLTKAGDPQQLLGEAVTWNYFQVLGVAPALGRSFTAEEDRPGANRVVILSHALWRDRFAADSRILGRSIWLNNEPHQVIGVMPAGFAGLMQYLSTTPASYFVPAGYPAALLANHGDHEVHGVGRLKQGMTIAQAQADLDVISRDLAARFPDTNADVFTRVVRLRDDIGRDVRTSLLILLGAVGVVVLIACVNVANLMIVRLVGQRREVAIRLALGASRMQIAVDMLTRGIVLAALGGAAGLLIGVWTRDWLALLAPRTIPRLNELGLTGRVVLMTGAVSLVTGLLAGLLPAWHSTRTELAPSLKTSEQSASGTRSLLRWRGALMTAEIAAAVVLTVGAGLLVRSLITLNRVDLGFDTSRVLTLNVRLADTRYRNQRERLGFFQDLADRTRLIPGVRRVAFANQFPMRGGWGSSFVLPSNVPDADLEAAVRAGSVTVYDADFQAVSPDYASVLGIPLVGGRWLTADDRAGTLPVAVVSQTFVTRFLFDGGDPIGRTFRMQGRPPITIVGVVGEIRRDGKAAERWPQVYLSAAQTDLYPVRLLSLAALADGDPHALVPAIQRAVWAIDADQPITGVVTLDEVVSASTAERRFQLLLLTSFAVLALTLALLGVYGVVAYATVQRTKEIGIRVALGAARRDVIALVVKSGVRWSLAGVGVGLLMASAATRIMRGMLFGIQPTDPLTFASVAALVFAVALVASYIPARRAATVDPTVALRAE